MIVWLNGALVDSSLARIDPFDRGFLLGDGLFETMAARGTLVPRLSAHRERLRRGCDLLGLPFPDVALDNAIQSLLIANQASGGAVRLTWTRGPGARGVVPSEALNPTLLLTVGPVPPPAPPARCVFAETTRRNEHSPLCQIKTINYLDNILARREAVLRGADDALLLNTAGRLAEATSSNLFVVHGSRILTPPVSDGALPGVVRDAILNAGDALEQPLAPEDILNADEIFLTNSLSWRAVRSLDSQEIPVPAEANSARIAIAHRFSAL
ncbi:MAG: aminotransferase class IV [Bdellovibrionales bacterium]